MDLELYFLKNYILLNTPSQYKVRFFIIIFKSLLEFNLEQKFRFFIES
jgi:hypothetical protein